MAWRTENPYGGSGPPIVVGGGFLTVDLSPQIDGIKSIFVLPSFVAGSVRVYRNGNREETVGLTEIGSTQVQLTVVPAAGPDPERLEADYVPTPP